jgi:hypothetical protein
LDGVLDGSCHFNCGLCEWGHDVGGKGSR